jgi:hypothetical protein
MSALCAQENNMQIDSLSIDDLVTMRDQLPEVLAP